MTKPNITTSETAECLRILELATGWLTATELARKLNLAGSRESQRRHVRAIVEHLRGDGEMIIATLQNGYFLTGDERLWKDYLEGLQIGAKRILGETHRRKKLVDSQGQGLLFEPPRIPCGIASMAVVG